MKNKQLKAIPEFHNEHEEDSFWQSANLEEYFDFSKFESVAFPNLKLTTKPITLRMPIGMIDRLKVEAHRLDMPYQTLAKQLIMKGLQENLNSIT